MMAKKLTLENVHLHPSEYGHWSVGCICEGARYHLWLDRSTRAPVGDFKGTPVLYKNPLDTGLRSSDPGYFRTRKLALDKGFGAILVPQLLEHVPTLWSAAEAMLNAKIADDKVKLAEARRANLAREHGVESLEVLRYIASSGESWQDCVTRARAMVRKIEGDW
jgi:hypothetical protein